MKNMSKKTEEQLAGQASGFNEGKVKAVHTPGKKMVRKAAAVLAAILGLVMIAGAVIARRNKVSIPTNIKPDYAIELLTEVKPYLYNSLIASDYKWTNTLKEGSTPKSFKELSAQYAEARTILNTNPEDAKALANANEALYGMGKSIMLAEICNGLGIDIENVVRFQYDGSIWHGNGQGGEPRFAWITYTNPSGEEISEQIQINGDLNSLSINSDVCASNKGVPQDKTNDERNEDLDDIYAALLRAICCEQKFYPEGMFRMYPTVITEYSEGHVCTLTEAMGDEMEQAEPSAKQTGYQKMLRPLSTRHKDPRFIQPYLRHRR